MKFRLIAAVLACLLGTSIPASAAPQGLSTEPGIDRVRNCVYNGFKYDPPTGVIAEAPHCFTTPDRSTIAPVATVDRSKTAADLTAVQDWSPLHPDHYVARDTFATRVVGPERAGNSPAIAAFVANDLPQIYLPDHFDSWLRTGANVGGGVHAHDNIPIYTVDSSNPHQQFATFASSDARVVNFPKLVEMTTGCLPIPAWARTSDGGDKAFATFDVGTGIMRGYFHAVKDSSGVWNFAASGYWYGNPQTREAGQHNYWLGYLTGSSSVIGISNELTQIGAEEVRRGQINHAVSVTFPNYQSGTTSFPAKQTDGNLDPGRYPNAPAAGQMFTFPASFDVEAYIRTKRIDRTTAAIMRAVKTYGGIVSDKNTWSMAFNFENPYGMGAHRNGTNLWKTDPQLSGAMNSMAINTFPWASTAWLPVNYAATTAPPATTPPATTPPTTTPPTTTPPTTTPRMGTDFAWGDQSGDRIGDVLVVDAAGTLHLRYGVPGGLSGASTAVGLGWGNFTWISHTPDVNGDRIDDLLGRRDDGKMFLYFGQGMGRFVSAREVGKNWQGLDNLTVVGDMNTDGIPEVVGIGSNGNLYRYTLTTSGLQDASFIGKNWQGMRFMTSVGDFNGDGTADILAVNDTGNLYVYYAGPGGTIIQAAQVGRGWSGFTAMFAPGDLTGDGRIDMLGRNRAGEMFLYANLGSGRWGSAAPIGSGWQDFVLFG